VSQPILPQRATPAAVQPHAGDAFALPANFTLKPRGNGQPLPEPIQKKMESFFNTSFADVRVHVGPEASSIGALAFTHGTDLYFAPGQYNPQTTQGQQLLGHELTHVLQQRAGRVRNPLGSGVAVVQDRALEAEAERMGLRAASATVPVQARPAGTGPVVASLQAAGLRPNTVAASGAILPARALVHDSVQRKPGPILPNKLSTPWELVPDTFSGPVNPMGPSRSAQTSPSRTVQRLTATQTVAEAAIVFDTATPITHLNHSRGANPTLNSVPPGQRDQRAIDQTVRHCIPYNYIRDQIRTICLSQPNRVFALTALNTIANSLNLPRENPAQIASRDQFDGALDRLIISIGNWSGNLFVCDGSSQDRMGRDRDNPPETWWGYRNLMQNVQALQWVLDTAMPRAQVQRQHFQGNVTQTGAPNNPIDIEMLEGAGFLS